MFLLQSLLISLELIDDGLQALVLHLGFYLPFDQSRG